MTGITPGRAFREKLHELWAARGRPVDLRSWDALPEEDRADLEAAARRAIEAAESYSTIYLNEIDRLATALRTIRDAHAPGEPGFDVARHTLDDSARVVGTRPQPAPGDSSGLRAAIAETVKSWREEAVPASTDTRDELTERWVYGERARELAGILDDHPEPQPAPALVTARAALRDIALGTAGDPSVAADEALTRMREAAAGTSPDVRPVPGRPRWHDVTCGGWFGGER